VEEEIPQDLDEKRIDLSQFDAITPGNWEIIETPNGGIHIGVRLGDNAHRHIITFTDSLGEQVKKIERDVADMNAIAAVPSLIAQLKICYEAIDHMKEALLEQTNTNIFLVQSLEQRDKELAGYKEVAETAGMYQRCCDQLGNEDDCICPVIKCVNIDYCGHDSTVMPKERFQEWRDDWVCTNCLSDLHDEAQFDSQRTL